jgi:hypothetical protein
VAGNDLLGQQRVAATECEPLLWRYGLGDRRDLAVQVTDRHGELTAQWHVQAGIMAAAPGASGAFQGHIRAEREALI